MFVITDCTASSSRKMTASDVKEIADIIIGITGSEEIAKKCSRMSVICLLEMRS